ncbi:MAG: DUF2147 domain-containing protein [Cyclobacteriaceae bacterium]
MHNSLILSPLLLLATVLNSNAQGIMGKWKTIDDETNEAKSVVEIVERNGKAYGKIIELFRTPNEDPDPLCSECPEDDKRYNKKVLGMEIILDMTADEEGYSGGTILDPKVGKVYRCKLWVEGNNLKVRGYWGPFYRTQTWDRYE